MLRMTKSGGGYIDSSATLGMTRKNARKDRKKGARNDRDGNGVMKEL